MRKRDYSIVKTLFEVLKKDIETFWIEEELVSSIENSIQTSSIICAKQILNAILEIIRDRQNHDQNHDEIQYLTNHHHGNELLRQNSFNHSRTHWKKENSQSDNDSHFFHSQNSQKSSSIELQNVQLADRWISFEESLLLKKSRRSISLRSFIESSLRSIFAFFILSSFSSFSHQAYTEKSSSESFKLITSIRIENDHKKKLANLAKLYTDEAKYGDENDSFSFKLTIFHDMCNRVDVSQSIKLKTFFIMLKDLAFDYYYSNMFINIMTLIIFDEICFSMRNYFEDVEYKRSILT
jgi:hypothetical protein